MLQDPMSPLQGSFDLTLNPRALPWAISFRPVGAEEKNLSFVS